MSGYYSVIHVALTPGPRLVKSPSSGTFEVLMAEERENWRVLQQ